MVDQYDCFRKLVDFNARYHKLRQSVNEKEINDFFNEVRGFFFR